MKFFPEAQIFIKKETRYHVTCQSTCISAKTKEKKIERNRDKKTKFNESRKKKRETHF